MENVNYMEDNQPEVKKNMSRMKQLKAILAKEYILWMSNISDFKFAIILALALAIISSRNSNKTFSYISPLILNLFVAINVILNNCSDRNEGFRSMFRLMGLSNISYIVGTLIFQILQSVGITTFYMVI